jgi:hypothetical protein
MEDALNRLILSLNEASEDGAKEYKRERQDQHTQTFKKNLKKFKGVKIRVDMMPKGMNSINKFEEVIPDAHLTLKIHMKRKFQYKGKRTRPELTFKTKGERKKIQVSGLYSQKKFVDKTAVEALRKKSNNRPAYFLQYKEKFFPYDLPDLTLAMVDILEGRAEIRNCLVINLSSSTRENIGEILSKSEDMEKVFRWLKVPHEKDLKDPEEPPTDSEKDLTPKQLDLYNNPADENSVDIGFKDEVESSSSIQRLMRLKNPTHQIKAIMLMLNRLDGTLSRTKDKKKRKNLLKSKALWLKAKKLVSKKFD